MYKFFYNLFLIINQNFCINNHDIKIWNTTGKIDFTNYMTSCGKQCFGNKNCVDICVKKSQNYTDNCCQCFGVIAYCTLEKCMEQCFNGNSPPCSSCIVNNCGNSFTYCSGINYNQLPHEHKRLRTRIKHTNL